MHPDDLAAHAHDLRMAILRLSRRLRSQRAVPGMSDGQLAVLVALRHGHARTPGDLAEREGVTPPSMNRTINALEECGYVARSTDSGDGRRVNLALTRRGRAVVDKTAARRDSFTESLLTQLQDDELAVLARAIPILERLASR